MVRWLQKSGGGSHLAGHMLFFWQRSSLVCPKPHKRGRARPSRPGRAVPQASHAYGKGCAAKPSATQASTAKPHGPGAAALYHTEQGKHMGKREKSALCQGEQIHAASVQIQQPNAEAAAAALCSAGALGSARAWSDRKQKERVNNGGLEAPFSTLFSFDSAQSHSIAYSSLQGGAQEPLKHTAVRGQPPSLVPCALPLKCCWRIWHKDPEE